MPKFITRFTLALIFLSSPAWAYYAVLDNAEVLQRGQYKLTGDAQILTDNGGLNIAGRFDAGLDDEFGMRGILGLGKTDFFLGGLIKWVPIPDIEGQPAVGFNAGLLYGKDNDASDLTIRFEPLLSKKVAINTTTFTPYASLPIGIRMRNSDRDDDTDMTWQLVAGSQLQIEQWKKLQFMAEVGIDLDNAPSYVAVGAVLYFDEESGLHIE